jgi:hypothetical protein
MLFAGTGLLLSFIGTPYPLQWHWVTAGSRVFLHLNPASALGLSLVLPAVFKATAARPGAAPEPTTVPA